VPDVTSLDEESARSQLESSGFQVEVVREATVDPSQDGFVLRQEPEGGSNAPEGSVVRIVVGELEG
jgi:beta-lactam-binding protein with PASTA domain